MVKRSKIMKEYYNAPQHIVSKRISASLSDSLQSQYNTKTVRLRKNDVVKILSGEYKNLDGKITHVYLAEGMISVDGITREKLAGGTTPVKIHESNVMVTSLDLKDPKRKTKLERCNIWEKNQVLKY